LPLYTSLIVCDLFEQLYRRGWAKVSRESRWHQLQPGGTLKQQKTKNDKFLHCN
jgi:hypothetical protein